MTQLTDQEKQEVIRFLEAGKPLPEKYRFLLFEDKREVELVWNGKTGDVTNVVLPFQVIEQVDEPRAESLKKMHRCSTTRASPSTRGVASFRAGPTRSSGATTNSF